MKTVGCLSRIKVHLHYRVPWFLRLWLDQVSLYFFLNISFCFSFKTYARYSLTLKSLYGEISRHSKITFTSVNEILFIIVLLKYNLFRRTNVFIQDVENKSTKHHEKENTLF